MTILNHSFGKPFQTIRKASLLAFSIALVSGAVLVSVAQVGPMPPPEKPHVEPATTKIKDSFGKFFGKKEGEEESGEATQGNFDKPKANSAPVSFKADPRRPETWGDDPKKPDHVSKPAGPSQQPAKEEPLHPPLLSQPPLNNAKIEDPQIDPNRPPKTTLRLDNPANPLGYADAVNQIKKVDDLIKDKRLTEARAVLIPLRQWLVDCTEAHINLYNTLNKLPSARSQAELEKQLALEFAMLRDRAMFELGLLYVEEKEHKKAVKELVEVIKSQPRSKVGILAYELLQEIGFTEKIQLDVGSSQKPAAGNDGAKE